jgi:hypothetical protein
MVDILCAGQQTEEDLRRFAVFDDNDRYVGLKLGLTADDINPNCFRDALSWGTYFVLFTSQDKSANLTA